MKKHFLFFLIAFIVLACNADKASHADHSGDLTADILPDAVTAAAIRDTFKTGIIIENIKCSNDTSKSFALYIPAHTSNKMPIVFFFDPHGDPVLPLSKYKSLADEFKFTIAGSYNSKNGNDWNTTAQIWSALFSDVSQRLTFDERRIYTAGFSGGAKVACYVALNNNNIAGVIANSAGFPETQQQAPVGNFNFIGIAGTGDMNVTELVTLNEQLDETAIKHQLLFFTGKHEWCPVATMNDAFTWFEFNAVKNNIASADQKLVFNFIALHNKKIERIKKENNLLALADEFKLMSNYLSDGISPTVIDYEKKLADLVKQPGYEKQLADYDALLAMEKNIKSNLATALQQNTDENFWRSTLHDLQQQSAATTPQGVMYKRVISYLSLACYSFSNRALNAGDNETAAKYIQLYKIVDPDNAEAWYLSAMLNARFKNNALVKTELEKAVEKGFNDWRRMKTQQEFAGINMAGIEN